MKMKPSSFSLSQENIDYINDQWKSKGKRSRSHWMDDLITFLREKDSKKSDSVATRKPVKTQSVFEYPPELNVAAWEEWKKYRKENKIRAYKPTPRSEGVAIKGLLELSGGDHNMQAEIIKQSMVNNYQGLFELRGSHAANKQASAQQSDGLSDSARAMYEARARRDAAQQNCGSTMGSDGGTLFEQVGQEERGNSFPALDGGPFYANE